jgi:hypothetical protein
MSDLDEARARAKRRKSRWNLALVPAVLLPTAAVWALAALAAERVHLHFFPDESLREGEGPWVVLAAVAPLFAAIAIGMLVGNTIVRRVGRACRALDREAAADPALSYRASQDALARLAVYATIASLVATLLGALMPW